MFSPLLLISRIYDHVFCLVNEWIERLPDNHAIAIWTTPLIVNNVVVSKFFSSIYHQAMDHS